MALGVGNSCTRILILSCLPTKDNSLYSYLKLLILGNVDYGINTAVKVNHVDGEMVEICIPVQRVAQVIYEKPD